VVELREEGHLGAELEQAPLVELLLDEPFDGHVDALPLALEHHPVRPQPHLFATPQGQPLGVKNTVMRVQYLLAEGDLVEVDDPAAEVGRREEGVLLEGQTLAHVQLQLGGLGRPVLPVNVRRHRTQRNGIVPVAVRIAALDNCRFDKES
jgi:hypothetical protein